MGARTAGADPAEIRAARGFGVALGSLDQMIDDYLDLFGSGELRRVAFEDFQAGRMTGPVIRLLPPALPRGRRMPGAAGDGGRGHAPERPARRPRTGSQARAPAIQDSHPIEIKDQPSEMPLMTSPQLARCCRASLSGLPGARTI